MNVERHTFKIRIGDWSGDGHGKERVYTATAAKPIADVREAYFAAKTKSRRLCPEEYANRYEDGSIPDDVQAALRKAGCPLPEDMDEFDTESMAAIVAWFINHGDPDCDVMLEPAADLPSLSFYGNDTKGRHIGFIGYGMLG